MCAKQNHNKACKNNLVWEQCKFNRTGTSPEDINQYVSLCAKCSHNEAVIRWSRVVDDDLLYRNFYVRYECYGPDGTTVIPEVVSSISL